MKNKFIYISIQNPKKEMNKLKGVFKPLSCYYKFSKKDHYPVLWCSKVRPIHIISRDVMWKDKYDSPRYEYPPYIWIHLFGFNFIWYWDLPENLNYLYVEDYWEQALWYLYYNNTISYGLEENPSILKAKESWPWEDYETKKSNWKDIFLIKR